MNRSERLEDLLRAARPMATAARCMAPICQAAMEHGLPDTAAWWTATYAVNAQISAYQWQMLVRAVEALDQEQAP